MKPVSFRVSLSLCAFLLLLSPAVVNGEKRAPTTSAHSIANPSYQREKLPSGEWKPEAYAFGKGATLDPTGRDASLIELTFEEMCEILAENLLKEQYVPTSSLEETQLLIVVNWGKTIPFDDGLGTVAIDGMSGTMNRMSQLKANIADRGSTNGSGAQPNAAESSEMSSMEGEMNMMLMMQDMADLARRKGNIHNAQLLGYMPDLSEAFDDYTDLPLSFKRTAFEDLMNEIETPRYFVILQAYDFKKWRLEKKKELLWMTRFSIRAKGRRFNEELFAMSSAASSLFGTESGRLKRRLRPGNIKMGEIEVLKTNEAETELIDPDFKE